MKRRISFKEFQLLTFVQGGGLGLAKLSSAVFEGWKKNTTPVAAAGGGSPGGAKKRPLWKSREKTYRGV